MQLPFTSKYRSLSTRRRFNRAVCRLLAIACAISLQGAPRLYPIDNAFSDVKDPNEQAALLKELGYDGICSRPGRVNLELLKALDEQGLELLASYVTLHPAKYETPPPFLERHFKNIQDRGTLVWLTLANPEVSDETAARLIEQVCLLAHNYGLEVVLYPHNNYKTDTVETCLKLLERADQPNLGLSFNLCHFLIQNPHTELEATIQSAGPHLKLVQINGANESRPQNGIADFIKPLGEGNFDMNRLFKALKDVNYDGDYNLQCFLIDKPAAVHLAESMEAWKQYSK